MKKKIMILSLPFCLLLPKVLFGQVTIGSGLEPVAGSLLELKEKPPMDPYTDNSTSNKGLGLPRVKLSNSEALYPMFLEDPADPSSGANDEYKAETDQINKEHAGLVVYNVGTALSEGLYCWNGKQWNLIVNTTVRSPAIATLICDEVFIDGSQTFVNGDTNFSTIARVPYRGGNGANYPEGPIIDCLTENGLVTGLKAQLQAGTLTEGNGELIYRIWADPAISGSSPAIAKFSISFNDESGSQLSCIISVGNATPIAKNESYVSIGPLIPTIDSEHQDEINKRYYVPGYERVVTTPDGRWSIRAFVPKGGSLVSYGGTEVVSNDYAKLVETDISIRPNDMEEKERKIMWSAHVVYSSGDYSASHILNIPSQASDRWGGNQGGAGNGEKRGGDKFIGLYPGSKRIIDGMEVSFQVALANPNVFDSNSPERRVYTFTEIGDVNNPPYSPRTVYTITFMMGCAADNIGKVVNDAVAATTTVYFKVEQSTSME